MQVLFGDPSDVSGDLTKFISITGQCCTGAVEPGTDRSARQYFCPSLSSCRIKRKNPFLGHRTSQNGSPSGDLLRPVNRWRRRSPHRPNRSSPQCESVRRHRFFACRQGRKAPTLEYFHAGLASTAMRITVAPGGAPCSIETGTEFRSASPVERKQRRRRSRLRVGRSRKEIQQWCSSHDRNWRVLDRLRITDHRSGPVLLPEPTNPHDVHNRENDARARRAAISVTNARAFAPDDLRATGTPSARLLP